MEFEMSDAQEETVHEYHAKLMAIWVRRIIRIARVNDFHAIGICTHWLAFYLTQVLNRYFTLPRPNDGIWNWNAGWNIDSLQLQGCNFQGFNSLQVLGTLICSLRKKAQGFPLPPGFAQTNQDESEAIRAGHRELQWIEPLEFQISLHPSSGKFAFCRFRVGDKRSFDEKQLPYARESRVLPETSLIEFSKHEFWLEEFEQTGPPDSNPVFNTDNRSSTVNSLEILEWKRAYRKILEWSVLRQQSQAKDLPKFSETAAGRIWLETLDEMVMALFRTYLRERSSHEDQEAAKDTWSLLESFLESAFRILLGCHDSRWDGMNRWIDGFGFEFVNLDPGYARLQTGRTYVMFKQNRCYFQPCEWEIEFCLATSKFKKYVVRFGDHRPLKDCRNSADPNHPVGGWAYVIERQANSATADK
jgi:hypothetical protein